MDDLSDELASIGQRVAARVIDWMLQFMAAFPVITPFDNSRVGFLVWMALIAAHEIIGVSRFGQTIGKRIINIKLVNAKTGALPSIRSASLRVAPVLACMAVLPGQLFPAGLVVLYFTAGFSADDYRGLLDRLAGTAVVRALR